MLEFTNKQRFSIEISILSNIDKKVPKFKRLFYAQGTEVSGNTTIPPLHHLGLLGPRAKALKLHVLFCFC